MEILFISVDCPDCDREIQMAVNINDKGIYLACCDICGNSFNVDTTDFEFSDIELNLN